MSDIQDDLKTKAEELKDGSPDQHLGDAMDDADLQPAGNATGDGELEAVGQGGPSETGGPTDDETEMTDDGGA